MLAISLDTEVEYNPQQSHLTLPELDLSDVGDVNTDEGDLSEELSLDDLQDIEQEEDVEIAAVDPQNLVGNNRRSTDLVRVYLQEIGKVRLLGRDEEVGEAQKVQRHLKIRLLLANAAKQGDAVIVLYLQLIEVQERLVSELGHRPSLERWASTAGIKLMDLKPTLSQGKRRWAEIAKLTVEELDEIQSQGIQAKEHMIKANLRLVVSVAKKYQNRGLELLDLVQEGTLGLERAVEKI